VIPPDEVRTMMLALLASHPAPGVWHLSGRTAEIVGHLVTRELVTLIRSDVRLTERGLDYARHLKNDKPTE
jgi:hypothetical protein